MSYVAEKFYRAVTSLLSDRDLRTRLQAAHYHLQFLPDVPIPLIVQPYKHAIDEAARKDAEFNHLDERGMESLAYQVFQGFINAAFDSGSFLPDELTDEFGRLSLPTQHTTSTGRTLPEESDCDKPHTQAETP